MHKSAHAFLALLLLALAALACGTQTPDATSTSSTAPASSATSVPLTNTPSPQPSDTPTPEPSPTPTQITVPVDMLSGLIYRKNDPGINPALWQFNANGISSAILNTENALFSPNYTYAAYPNDGVWVADFNNQTLKKLSNPQQNYLQAIGWLSSNELVVWTDHHDGILAVSVDDAKTDEIAYLYYGLYCVGVSTEGKVAVIMPGDGPVPGWVEVYPDGFPSNESTSTVIDNLGVPCPSWSPDGRDMAWLTSHYEDNYIFGVGIVDMNGATGSVFHETTDQFVSFTEQLGLDRSLDRNDYITWASDNQHLAFATQAEDGTISYWISTVDGQTEYQLPNWPIWNPVQPWLAYWDFEHDPAKPELWIMETNGENAQMVGTRDGGSATDAYMSTLWSPDGELLLYQNADGTLWLSDLDTRKAHQVDITFQGELVTWIPPLNVQLADLVALPTPIPFSCPNAPQPRVQVGQTARVTITGSGGTRLRSSPDVLPDNILASLVEGQEFEIIGGPVCSDRPGRSDAYVYWEVSLPARNLTGWVAEGDFEDYYIEPWP